MDKEKFSCLKCHKLALELAGLRKCPGNIKNGFCSDDKCEKKNISQIMTCWAAWLNKED